MACLQDKTALEARCKELQALLENVQSQRSDNRQAFKVRALHILDLPVSAPDSQLAGCTASSPACGLIACSAV